MALLFIYRWNARSSHFVFDLVASDSTNELLKIEGRTQWRIIEEAKLSEVRNSVVIDLHNTQNPKWIKFIADCTLNGIPIYHSAFLFESLTGRVSLKHLEMGVTSRSGPSLLYSKIRRFLEVLGIIIAAPFCLLVGAIIALLIKLDSPGSALFTQKRVGFKGKEFTLYKFRTMYVDAEKNGSQFAHSGDKRITRLGRILRKWRIDEWPQFLNVLRGEMSLIGPRPEQVSFAREYEEKIPFYSFRYLVRPGLTGWAQVSQGYAAGADENQIKVEYDLYYVKNVSFWLDLWILIKSVSIVLFGKGAR